MLSDLMELSVTGYQKLVIPAAETIDSINHEALVSEINLLFNLLLIIINKKVLGEQKYPGIFKNCRLFPIFILK